jgi:pimeloyl-ACP methyl ester carboxylesterase
MYPMIATDALTREAFFSSDAPASVVESCRSRLQNESYVAYLQMFAVTPRPHRVTTPVRVLAAERDALFSVEEQSRMAAAYGTEAVVVSGAGHDLMLDPAGAPALDQLLEWIDQT